MTGNTRIDGDPTGLGAAPRRTGWNRWPLIYITAACGLGLLLAGLEHRDLRGFVPPAIVLLLLTASLAVRLHRHARHHKKWNRQWVLWPARIVAGLALVALAAMAIFVAASDDWFWVDVAPEVEVTRLGAGMRLIRDVAVSPDGNRVAAWGWLGASSRSELTLWDSRTLASKRRPIDTQYTSPLPTFSPDGTLLATVEASETVGQSEIVLRRVPALERVAASAPIVNRPTCLAFSPDGAHAWMSCLDGTIRSYRVPSLEESDDLSSILVARMGHVQLAMTPDGKLISSGGDARLRVWEAVSGKLLATLTGHRQPIAALAVTPDGKTAATTSSDGSVLLWDLATFTQKAVLIQRRPSGTRSSFGERFLDFSPDGRLLVFSGSRERQGVSLALAQRRLTDEYWMSEVIVWNVESRSVVQSWSSHATFISKVRFYRSNEVLGVRNGADAVLLRIP